MGTTQLAEAGIPRMAALQHLVAEIQAYCAAYAEAQIVAKYAKHFKER